MGKCPLTCLIASICKRIRTVGRSNTALSTRGFQPFQHIRIKSADYPVSGWNTYIYICVCVSLWKNKKTHSGVAVDLHKLSSRSELNCTTSMSEHPPVLPLRLVRGQSPSLSGDKDMATSLLPHLATNILRETLMCYTHDLGLSVHGGTGLYNKKSH